ncbi:MAG: SIR2 family NAD-dependent protein deacylase [Syntrophomonadaceae bacterium]|jgi:NAD-dependent deacetylase
MDRDAIGRIVDILAKSNQTVVVTGAGISTEAGIPDFRGENGIYRKLGGEEAVMEIININTFRRNPEKFYEFYKAHFVLPPVQPSKAHLALARMEKKGWIKAVVTQNVDSLHQNAGTQNLIPIHGTRNRFICTGGCPGVYDWDYILKLPKVVPTCPNCDKVLKPDVVLFGEPINNYQIAEQTIAEASALVVIGSSLSVYPLAAFVRDYDNGELIIINRGPTELDYAATIKLDTNQTGDTLEEIEKRLEETA